MPIIPSPALRQSLIADAVVSGVAAVVMVLGASLLEPILHLPASLLQSSGLALLPFVALLVFMSRRVTAPRKVMLAIIAVNELWVVGSIALLLLDLVSPNILGVGFIAAQAAAVAALSCAQWVGLRRSVTALG
jgi:hypothetical protein